MSEWDEDDRRLCGRIKGNFAIQIKEDKDTVEVHAIDLSLSGLRFRSKKNIPLFREITLKLKLPISNELEKPFQCNAIVVRSEKSHHGDAYSIALTFVDIEDEDRDVLAAFLDQMIDQEELI